MLQGGISVGSGSRKGQGFGFGFRAKAVWEGLWFGFREGLIGARLGALWGRVEGLGVGTCRGFTI